MASVKGADSLPPSEFTSGSASSADSPGAVGGLLFLLNVESVV